MTGLRSQTSRLGAAVLATCLSALPLLAGIVVVENTSGSITVRVVNREDVDIQGRSASRPIQSADIEIERKPAAGVIVRPASESGSTIDLELEVPYQTSLGLTTTTGKITVEGMPAALDVETESGDLELALPWYSSYLDFLAEKPPGELRIPDHLERKRKKRGLQLKQHRRVGLEYGGYSDVLVRTQSSRVVELREIPIPEDSPIKLHWQGAAALEGLFSHEGPVRLQERSRPQGESAPEAKADFRTEVELVDLLVHVTDKQGRMLTDLDPGDFRVTENGAPQTIRSAARVNIPVNIVVFLDWNNSMMGDAGNTLRAVDLFIDSLRSGDKMALHLLTRNTVHIFPRLTADPAKLRRGLHSFAALLVANSRQTRNSLGGTSGVWDPLLVSMTDELPDHDDELNLFIPITMGADLFSKVPFPKVRGAVEQMASDLTIRTYPVAVGNSLGPGPKHRIWKPILKAGRNHLHALAKAGDGRVFEAEAPQHIGAVLDKILAEVGSAYSLSYAPAGEDADEDWRQVTVEVQRPGAVVRHRPGYFARP